MAVPAVRRRCGYAACQARGNRKKCSRPCGRKRGGGRAHTSGERRCRFHGDSRREDERLQMMGRTEKIAPHSRDAQGGIVLPLRLSCRFRSRCRPAGARNRPAARHRHPAAGKKPRGRSCHRGRNRQTWFWRQRLRSEAQPTRMFQSRASAGGRHVPDRSIAGGSATTTVELRSAPGTDQHRAVHGTVCGEAGGPDAGAARGRHATVEQDWVGESVETALVRARGTGNAARWRRPAIRSGRSSGAGEDCRSGCGKRFAAAA